MNEQADIMAEERAADARQQMEEERLERTLAALDACRKAGASEDDLETLACELGVRQWWRNQQEKTQ